MAEIFWTFQEHVARLHSGRLAASLDLLQPQQGLHDVVCCDSRLAALRLLGIDIVPSSTEAFDAAADRYVRGCDLVAVYEKSVSRPMHVEALWRGLAASPEDPWTDAVDLIVSVRTHCLETQPRLHVQSDVPADEILQLTDRGGFVPQPPPGAEEEPTVLERPRGRGCLLFRLPGAQISYAEMVHPVDFHQDELAAGRRSEPATATSRLRHHLFASLLEKGVLLRARVRGIFLPRREDERLAAGCYAAFAAAEPPLA